jgi:hypothetical protein
VTYTIVITSSDFGGRSPMLVLNVFFLSKVKHLVRYSLSLSLFLFLLSFSFYLLSFLFSLFSFLFYLFLFSLFLYLFSFPFSFLFSFVFSLCLLSLPSSNRYADFPLAMAPSYTSRACSFSFNTPFTLLPSTVA